MAEDGRARAGQLVAYRVEVGDRPGDRVRATPLRAAAAALIPPYDPDRAAQQFGDVAEVVPQARPAVTEHQRVTVPIPAAHRRQPSSARTRKLTTVSLHNRE